MKLWHYIVLLAVGAVGIGYVYEHRAELGLVRAPDARVISGASAGMGTGTDESEEPMAAVGRPAEVSWRQADRSVDGFKVDMPGDIEELQIPAYNETGGQDQVNMIFSNADAETTFSVAWSDDPPVARVNDRNPNKILDMARDDAMARTQTSLTGESRTTVAGFPGRDFSASNVGGGVLNSRLIYANPRLYMLIASFPSASARREEDVLRFFNSFQIVPSGTIPETMPLAPAEIVN